MATRPTTVPSAFATNGGTRVAPTPARNATGFQSAEAVPPLTNNELMGLNRDWVIYLSELSPSSDVLAFREWECLDDSSYEIRWSDASSPASDGLLIGDIKGASLTLDSGTRFSVGGSGSLGYSASHGVYLYGFTYETASDTILTGSPPDLLDIYAPAACQVLSDGTMTFALDIDGSVILTTASLGVAAEAAIFLGYHGGAKGDEASAGETDCYLRSASIQVLNHTASGGGNPDTDVSIQSMAADGTWTTRATSNLTTIISSTSTAVSIAPIASAVREIPRGAPLRILVEHAAIPVQTQQIEILSASLTYIRTAVD